MPGNPSKIQWIVIALVTLNGFLTAGGPVAGMLGAATGSFLVSYVAVLGYNRIGVSGAVKRRVRSLR